MSMQSEKHVLKGALRWSMKSFHTDFNTKRGIKYNVPLPYSCCFLCVHLFLPFSMTNFTIIKIRLLGSQLFFTWPTDDWQEEPQANKGPRQTMGRRQEINQKPFLGSIDKGPHPITHAFTYFRLMFYSCSDETLCRARLACPKDTTHAAGCHCSHVVYVLTSLEYALLLLH